MSAVETERRRAAGDRAPRRLPGRPGSRGPERLGMAVSFLCLLIIVRGVVGGVFRSASGARYWALVVVLPLAALGVFALAQHAVRWTRARRRGERAAPQPALWWAILAAELAAVALLGVVPEVRARAALARPRAWPAAESDGVRATLVTHVRGRELRYAMELTCASAARCDGLERAEVWLDWEKGGVSFHTDVFTLGRPRHLRVEAVEPLSADEARAYPTAKEWGFVTLRSLRP